MSAPNYNYIKNIVPYIPEKDKKNVSTMDIFSRLMMDRIIFLGEEITDEVSNIIQGQLLFLNNEDRYKPIHMYINSGGGNCDSGFAIIDTMNFIEAPVYTTCTGKAHSMASLILCSGEKGHRACLPTSTIMIHQPSWGVSGTQKEMEIRAKEITRIREIIEQIYCDKCNKSHKDIHKALENDNWMSAEEALKFGIIDTIRIDKNRRKELDKDDKIVLFE